MTMHELSEMTPAEFMRMGGELVADARREGRIAGRVGIILLVKQIIQQARMPETTRRYLLNQVEALRTDT